MRALEQQLLNIKAHLKDDVETLFKAKVHRWHLLSRPHCFRAQLLLAVILSSSSLLLKRRLLVRKFESHGFFLEIRFHLSIMFFQSSDSSLLGRTCNLLRAQIRAPYSLGMLFAKRVSM